jgi:hypothetical protein
LLEAWNLLIAATLLLATLLSYSYCLYCLMIFSPQAYMLACF